MNLIYCQTTALKIMVGLQDSCRTLPYKPYKGNRIKAVLSGAV